LFSASCGCFSFATISITSALYPPSFAIAFRTASSEGCFNRTVVLRYRFFLEQKNLAPSTMNVRLAAVRMLAYEGSNTGLLSPELAAGIGRVKVAKRLGVRIRNC
jgi:hypothetical protein